MTSERSPAMFDDLDGYVAALQATFDPLAAAGRGATIQYHFTGRVTGDCYVRVEHGALTASLGAASAPDVAVTADFDLWRQILAHQMDGLMAWQEGRFTATGAIEILMESDLWFRR